MKSSNIPGEGGGLGRDVVAIGAERKVEVGAKVGQGRKNGEARRYGARGADRAGGA